MTDEGFDAGGGDGGDGGWGDGYGGVSTDGGGYGATPVATDGGSTDWSGGGSGDEDGGGSVDPATAAAVAGAVEDVATSVSTVATEVEAYVDKTLAEFKRMYSEYRYGSYCGPGGGGNPIDDIDTCCMNHDHAYEAVGQSGSNLSVMFSAAGVVATESADSALVSCLNATITGPTWHDPAAVVYREAAVAIFGARAAAAEYIRSHGG